jgi:hypothetical protein
LSPNSALRAEFHEPLCLALDEIVADSAVALSDCDRPVAEHCLQGSE